MAIKYIVDGKRWFDKVNGNTYHSVTVTDTDNNIVFKSGITYGYGDQWQYTSIDGLIKAGLFNEKDRFNDELKRELFYFTVADVSRKRDL